jgi:hypothetical protein
MPPDPAPRADRSSRPSVPGPTKKATKETIWTAVGALAATAGVLIALLAYAVPHSDPPANPTQAPVSSSESPPAPQPTTAPATTSAPDPLPSYSPAFNPDSLNSSLTDTTPFTEAALMPATFTDNEGDTFMLVAGGWHQCDQAYEMGPITQQVLSNYGCTTVMTGDYVLSGDVGYNTQILVSVQVFPLNDSSDAATVISNFPNGTDWNFGVFCPKSGIASGTCNPGYEDAQRYEFLHQEYRYVIEATAVYVNLTQAPSADPFLSSASIEGATDSGPSAYWGAQY